MGYGKNPFFKGRAAGAFLLGYEYVDHSSEIVEGYDGADKLGRSGGPKGEPLDDF